MVKRFEVLILGGGSGGISVASRLVRVLGSGSVGIVEPSDTHFYQPLWSLVGAGQAKKEESAKPMSQVIPQGAEWIRDSVVKVLPEQNQVLLKGGDTLAYEFLVVATGLQLNWEKIPGIAGRIGQSGICSIYEYHQAERTFQMFREFQGGDAYFIMPPVPIKCAGAPQKIMYLFDDLMRQWGRRDQVRITYVTASQAIFGIPVFAQALERIRQEKNITVWFGHRLEQVDPDQRTVTFIVTSPSGLVERKTVKYDLLHVVPTQSAHQYVIESGLAHEEGDHKGWLAVDKYTLQHFRFGNIFGIGDVTGIPNAKTGAAIRKQAPGVVENILRVKKGLAPKPFYDGYSSCPLVVGIGKVILAEFGYDGKLMPTFPINPAVPRRSFWFLK
ncbi:MAG: NAD(P)/FAD-dependent oxidoreductase, partial [Bdellovibrionaceae bacterium]|nr:NAD(P)/FAD-dependent oxidoreductase [Pseudobdellovibrionaceae bacterium]